MKKKQLPFILMITSFFLLSATVVQAVDETITDPEDDVLVIISDDEGDDVQTYTTDQKPNIDIVEATYTNNGGTVTLTLTVKGEIENKGDLMSFEDLITYGINLETDSSYYSIYYINENCSLVRGMSSGEEFPEYEIQNQDTISVAFELDSPDEVFTNLSVETLEFSITEGTIAYQDSYPNVDLFYVYADGPSEATIDENLEFNGNAYFGQQPYSWQWDFGDGETSTTQNTTHSYDEEGTYTVTLEVIDDAGSSTSHSFDIIISNDSNGNGNGGDGANNLLLFIIAIIAVVVVGVIVLVFILRR